MIRTLRRDANALAHRQRHALVLSPRVATLIALALAILLALLASGLARAGDDADGAKSLLNATNGILTVTIESTTGQFRITTGANHPQPGKTVFYAGSTSYITLRDATSSTMFVNSGFSTSAGLAGYSVASLYGTGVTTIALGSTGFRTTFNVANYRVDQDVVINGTSLGDTNVSHQVTVTNTSAAARQFGLRYLWDWEIASNDASYFRTRGPDGAFTGTFATFDNPGFARYEEVDNTATPTFSVFGTVGGTSPNPAPTPPEQLRYSSWSASVVSAWDYANSGSGSDSAVTYYWGFNAPLTLAAGASRSFVQYVTTQISAVGGPAPSVSVFVTPSRLTQSGPVTVSWVGSGVTSCTPSTNGAGTTIAGGANGASGSVVANVVAGAAIRTDTFTVTCSGSGGTVSGVAALVVGIPPPPAPIPVANVSAAPNGQVANGVSRSIALSEGGRYIVFESAASNLVAGDTNGKQDVFIRDVAAGGITRVSANADGSQLNQFGGEARVSRDGKVVAFTLGSGLLQPKDRSGKAGIGGGQICLRDFGINVMRCVNKGPAGQQQNGASGSPDLSGDGKTLVYESTSTNLTNDGDANGSGTDVFEYVGRTDTTKMLSLPDPGGSSAGVSGKPHLSCNAAHFVFESTARLVGGNVQPGVKNIYFGDFPLATKRLVTVGYAGDAANGDSSNAHVTDDGRHVVFESNATNLVPNDTNGSSDVFMADLSSGTIRRLSVSTSGQQGNRGSRKPSVSCDGTFVTFETDADNLVASDTNARTDVALLNLSSGSLTLESRNSSGGNTDGTSGDPDISPDGTSIGYESDAPNLGSGTQTNVYAGGNPYGAQNYTGAWYDPAQAGHGLFLNQLPDGTLVAWWFTFDPQGQQAWFGGTGPLQGNLALVSVVRTQGARFFPNFSKDDAQNVSIGTLLFTFSACDRGRVDFTLDSTFGTGSMNLTRLTAPVGVNCNPNGTMDAVKVSAAGAAPMAPLSKAAVETTIGPVAGATSAWYDPQQPGQGLFIEDLGNHQILAWWFTFGPNGGQAWFGGVGSILEPTRAHIDFVRTQGGRWIPNFNPAQVTNPAIGSIEIVFPTCDSGTVYYNFGGGFGSGQYRISRLFNSVGTVCAAAP